MLLPSALPCDLRSQSLSVSVSSPQRRASRIVSIPAPSNPPAQDPTANAVATGLLHTCRRLQSILSLNRLSSSAPQLAPSTSLNCGVRKTRRTTDDASSASSSRTRRARAPKRPIRRNKRTCDNAFPLNQSPSACINDAEEENRFDRSMFTTPPPTKRTRLTTPPPAPDRGPARWNRVSNQLESLEDSDDDATWTDAEDRHLISMVLGKLEPTKEEWEQYARTLGKKNGDVVGRRWMVLLGNVGLNSERRRQIREQNQRVIKRRS